MRYRFDDYALDTDLRELRRGSDLVAIAPLVFDLLVFLIRNRDRFVAKDGLIDAIWNGRAITDTALTTRLYAARRAVGDTGRSPRVIKTLPRKGFRFVSAVREERGPKNTLLGDRASQMARAELSVPGRPSIAVLTFANLSGDTCTGFAVEGFSDDLVTELSKLRWLLVMAPKSGFTHKSRGSDIGEISHALDTRYVLEGSVRRLTGRARVSGRLVDARTGACIWAERFDCNPSGIFIVAEALAASVASAIIRTERQRALRQHPEQLGAWEAHQRGVWHMSKCDAAENHVARTFSNARSNSIQHTLRDLEPSHGLR